MILELMPSRAKTYHIFLKTIACYVTPGHKYNCVIMRGWITEATPTLTVQDFLHGLTRPHTVL